MTEVITPRKPEYLTTRTCLPPDGKAYCGFCFEYLGNYIKGVLYKNGQVVTKPHLCSKENLRGVQ